MITRILHISVLNTLILKEFVEFPVVLKKEVLGSDSHENLRKRCTVCEKILNQCLRIILAFKYRTRGKFDEIGAEKGVITRHEIN